MRANVYHDASVATTSAVGFRPCEGLACYASAVPRRPQEETGLLKVAPPEYEQLLIDLQLALGPDRKPHLIGIDGREGVGKTSLSSWLAWQLRMPVIHLDLFLKQNEVPAPVTRRTVDLDRCIKARSKRPFIVEGVLLLDAMEELDGSVDFLIFVEEQAAISTRSRIDADLLDTREFSLPNQVKAYLTRRAPGDMANFKLRAY
jgi:uridine kinase